MTASTTKPRSALEAARALHSAGRLGEAEQAYRKLVESDEHREAALQGLFDLSVKSGQWQQAVETLRALIDQAPDSLTYHAQLAELMQGLGQPELAIAYYERMLQRFPDLADGHFSLAVLYKRSFRYQDAIRSYEKALEIGIRNEQEVYSNLGVLYSDMRDADRARKMYERALEVEVSYRPALFNLAGLYEECGQRERAIELYERILAHDPSDWESLARLAQCTKPEGPRDPIIDRLRAALGRDGVDALSKESLYFALGRVLDELGRYEDAFAAYSEGNALGKRRSKPYDRTAVSHAFDDLIRLFSADWISHHATESPERPILICGMYRSGSTLVEQMLGQHPDITAGGELDFLPWLISRNLGPYPQRARQVSPKELQRIANAYVSMTRSLFPGAKHLTDKRPDNFLHLGLVKALFPRVRIVYTKRESRDNCLSILFQQLGGNLAYSNDFEDTADYYAQHVRLMDHWHALFGDDIFTVDYDRLVRDPEPVLRGLVDFLGLEWDGRCLEFAHSTGPVKTASLWQVREGLHQDSSGRWQNYRAFIPSLQ